MIAIKSTKVINHVEWNNFYSFYKDYYLMKNNTKFEYDLESFLELFKKINLNTNVENYLICAGINIIGRIELNISKQIETVSLQINLVSNSKIYLNEICLNEFVDQLKFRFKVLRLESDNLEIISLFEKLNFKRTNTLFELRLHKEEFVNCEIQNQPTENFEVKIQYELTNQELIELSALYNVCFKEMIKNENYNYSNSITGFKEFLDSINEYDKKIVFSILKNAQQETIGFSSVICSTKKLPISEHLFSCIRKDFRGQKLSLLIKQKLYGHLFENEKHIKAIRTECFEVNKPILKINDKLGFKIFNKNHELYFSW